MSGKVSSVDEQLVKVENILEEYENNVGIPQLKHPGQSSEFERYFTMERDIIEKMSATDCVQVAYRLGQFAYYVQRLINREHSRVAWANECLNHIIVKHLNNFDKYWKHDMKVTAIIQENSVANAYRKLHNHAEQRVLDLTFLSNSIKNLADIMISNQRAKIKDNIYERNTNQSE